MRTGIYVVTTQIIVNQMNSPGLVERETILSLIIDSKFYAEDLWSHTWKWYYG